MALDPLPRRNLDELDSLPAEPPMLHAGLLPAHVLASPQRQHDGADHGDQQDHAGRLEDVDVAGIQQRAERYGVRDTGHRGCRRRDRRGNVGRGDPGAEDQHELRQQHQPDQGADGEVAQETLAQLYEIDVEHHHHEQEQHRDRTDVNYDQDHREELGAQQDEKPGRVEKREDQEQDRVYGIARGHHHGAGGDQHDGEEPEDQRLDHHCAGLLLLAPSLLTLPLLSPRGARGEGLVGSELTWPLSALPYGRGGREGPVAKPWEGEVRGTIKGLTSYRYGASRARFLAISASQRSPFASSFSLS